VVLRPPTRDRATDRAGDRAGGVRERRDRDVPALRVAQRDAVLALWRVVFDAPTPA